MARSKVKMNFSYDKLSRKLAQNITTGINQLGKRINIKIGENLKNGVDLSGTKSHKPLSPDSTIPIRNRRGQGNKPLVISGKLEERKIKQATISNPVFEIEMTGKGRKGFIYGSLHQKGYTTAATSAIPNKKVPARKWFGIPKSCKPGGKDWKKSVATTAILNKVAWKK